MSKADDLLPLIVFRSNTIRLWYPQLAAMIGSEENGSLCSALAPAPADSGPCAPLQPDMLTYLQSAMVGAGSVLTYSIGGALVNRSENVCHLCN